MSSFLIKENILVLRRYQLHPAPKNILRHHRCTTAKKQEKMKTKTPSRGDEPLAIQASNTTPGLQTRLFKSNASKKKTMPKHRRRPIIDLEFLA
jgi:hypothetical protein